MQTEKLQYYEGQEEYSRQTGAQQVLQILQKAYPTQGNEVKNQSNEIIVQSA